LKTQTLKFYKKSLDQAKKNLVKKFKISVQTGVLVKLSLIVKLPLFAQIKKYNIQIVRG
jgi:hypothetical protein